MIVFLLVVPGCGGSSNQAVSGDTLGALNTLRGLVVRINRSSADLVSPGAKTALTAAINTLIAQL